MSFVKNLRALVVGLFGRVSREGTRTILADKGERIYIIESKLVVFFDKPGAVAQLGERVNGIHEVRGSIPLSSTNFPPCKSHHSIPIQIETVQFCVHCLVL